jgi:hypothetical protein
VLLALSGNSAPVGSDLHRQQQQELHQQQLQHSGKKQINQAARQGVLNSAMMDTSVPAERVGRKMHDRNPLHDSTGSHVFPQAADGNAAAISSSSRSYSSSSSFSSASSTASTVASSYSRGNPGNRSSQMAETFTRPTEAIHAKRVMSSGEQLGLSGLVALGVESGDIPDIAIRASSALAPESGGEAARLNGPSAWLAAQLDGNQFVQFDLGAVCDVATIVTQGAPHRRHQFWLTGFRVRYADPSTGVWRSLLDANEHERVFRGNTDTSTPAVTDVVAQCGSPVRAQHVRIYANNWNNGIGLRCELFGARSSHAAVGPAPDAKRSSMSLSQEEYARPKFVSEYDPYSKQMSGLPRAALGAGVSRSRDTAGTYSQIRFG